MANSIACIRALAQLLRLGFQQAVLADVVEEAISAVLCSEQGVTADLAGLAGTSTQVSTDCMRGRLVQAVAQRLDVV